MAGIAPNAGVHAVQAASATQPQSSPAVQSRVTDVGSAALKLILQALTGTGTNLDKSA